MEPVTMMMAASAVIGAAGAIQQGNAQSSSFKSQANAADYNAKVAEQNQQMAREQGNAREEMHRANARRFLGSQRAAVVQSGVDASSGTAAAVQADSAVQQELDALMIRYESELQGRDFGSAAVLERNQAAMSRSNARSSRTSGYINAGASMLGGYASYASNAARIAKMGGGG
jgi:hypothetical protein